MVDPVMALVRVKAPAGVDPYVLEAELTRAIHTRAMTAEVTLLPARRLHPKDGLCRHGFVALLCSAKARSTAKITSRAEKAVRKALRRRFGAGASARVRPASSPYELSTFWCSVRGTPRRP